MTARYSCPFAKSKAVYKSRRAAWRDIRGDMGRPTPGDYSLRPFKCQCGKWHVSSTKFVALRRDEGSRIWTVFTKNGRVGFQLRGPHNRGIAVEWSRRDAARVMWALVKGMVRA